MTAPTDLALLVIARNEARGIARCLQSAQPYVRRMVVLDTGSTDDTVQIARSCGAQVYQEPWRDDFAWARNRALELADAHWSLFLDADEWLESGGQSLAQAVQACEPKLGAVLVKSDFTQGGRVQQAGSWLTRLVPRGVRYQGRVHEQVVSSLPRQRLPVVVGHSGYQPEAMQAKRGRNRALLLQELQAQPDSAYILYQLGKDCEVFEELEQARDYYLRAGAACPADAHYAHDLHVRLLYSLGKSGRLDDAVVLAGDMMERWRDSPDFFFTVGNLFLDRAIAHPQTASAQSLPMVEQAWLRCLAIGECPDLEGSVVGRGSFLAAHNLAVLYEGLGRKDEAGRYAQLAAQLRDAQQSVARSVIETRPG
ncbi:MAG TPA: glycosyltransferase family 2 protein [Bordetella sp.]|uniref:glycosyltransferase family 2 protein n=1 Tax=Bordetella sp. TaxID=28081 RepID=UPI002ED34FC4